MRKPRGTSPRWMWPFVVGLIAGLVTALLAWWRPDAIERAELWSYDIRVRKTLTQAPAPTGFVMLDIAEHDLESVETNMMLSWPWPRELFGYLAQYATRGGAKVVVFDWLFQDRGYYSIADAQTFAEALRATQRSVIGLALTRRGQAALSEVGPYAARVARGLLAVEAEALALLAHSWNLAAFLVPDAVAPPAGSAGASVVVASEKATFEVWVGGLASETDCNATLLRLQTQDGAAALFESTASLDSEVGPRGGGGGVAGAAAADGASSANAVASPPPAPMTCAHLSAGQLATRFTTRDAVLNRYARTLTGVLPLPQLAAMDPPLGVLATAAAGVGHVHQTNDRDGVFRHTSLLVQHDEQRYLPSLPLAAYLVAHPDAALSVEPGRAPRLRVGAQVIPLDASGRVALKWLSLANVTRVSAYEVLRSIELIENGQAPSVDPAIFKDKYVIVSPSALALRDLRVTPISSTQRGAEINAIAIANLESTGFVARTTAAIDALTCLVVALLMAGTIAMVWQRVRATWVVAVAVLTLTACAVGALFVTASWLLAAQQRWVGLMMPATTAVLTAFATMLTVSAQERRNRRFATEALGRYTSRALVAELMANPAHLSLQWGQKRPMTVYFSDIAGFTSISEGLSPEALVALLNEYLTAMTDIVLAHGGVVDKYIGDAVMAFWGAPVANPNHARDAVRAAVAMRKCCDQMRAVWKAKYGYEIYARAGLNTGEAVVGNMGSLHKYNYTVMGDMVNLASRLEGANKVYGTYLMISESTRAEVQDTVFVRELDLVAVKGKDVPVRVYEVLDVTAHVTTAQRQLAAAFADALQWYREGDFARARTAFSALAANDAAAAMYVARCDTLLNEPPRYDGNGCWDGVWRLTEK